MSDYSTFLSNMMADLGTLGTYEEMSARLLEAQHADSRSRHFGAIWRLLEITENLLPPKDLGFGVFEHREFIAADGWKVTIFYDNGQIDYIDHFTTPDGRVIDFWDWSEDTPGRKILMGWNGVGSRAWLIQNAASLGFV